MIAVDTSVVIPAVLSWHEAHEVARGAAQGSALPAHALVEAYSVLTRLPATHRLVPGVAGQLLAGWFPSERILPPSGPLAVSIVERLVSAGVHGGSSYDALIGLTAADHGLELLTLDERAATTYDAVGVRYQLLTS